MNNAIWSKLKGPKNKRIFIVLFCLVLVVVLLYTYIVWYVTMFIAAEQYLMRSDISHSMNKGTYVTDARYILVDLDVYNDGIVSTNKGAFWIPKWRVKQMVKNLAAQKYGESVIDFDGIQIVSIDKQNLPSPFNDPVYRYEVKVIIPKEGDENLEIEAFLLYRRW